MTDNHPSQPLSDAEQLLAAGYVLGDLTEEEIGQLESLVAQNPRLRQELHSLQVSFELLPQALETVTPPANLFAEKTINGLDVGLPKSLQRPIPLVLRWVTGLAALAALILAADNFRLRHQLQIIQQVNPQHVAKILQQPNSRLISLTGENTDAAGTLLFSPGNWQEVIVSLGNLPALPPDQIYRMWLALENGDIIYCGAFNTTPDGSVFVRFTPPESPPRGVKATELFVTIDSDTALPDSSGERVMQGGI